MLACTTGQVLEEAAHMNISKFVPDFARAQAEIPILDLRSLSCFVDIARTFKTINAQRRMHGAEVCIANAIPRIPEAAQLNSTL